MMNRIESSTDARAMLSATDDSLSRGLQTARFSRFGEVYDYRSTAQAEACGSEKGSRVTPFVLRLVLLVGALAGTAGAQTNGAGGKIKAETVQPARKPVTRSMSMPATVVADEQVDLFAKASGYVGMIDIDIGSHVKKGDVLVRIDVPEMADELKQSHSLLEAKKAKVKALQANATQAARNVETAAAEVKQYEARYQLDQINLKRKQELREGNAIPQQALDEALSAHTIAEAKLDIAKAKVAAAKAQHQAVEADVQVAQADVAVAQASVGRLDTLMKYAEITAPFDGIITQRGVDHGAFVRSAAEGTTAPLLQIAKTDRVRIVMDVAETDVPFVRAGTPVTIKVGALGGEPFRATVTRTAGALSPQTRTMRAEADLDNGDNRLTPGMYAQVTLELESKSQAMMIPSKAVRGAGKETIVLVVDHGLAAARRVKIGYDDGIWAEVLSGLNGDEAVITATGGAVVEGTAVTAVKSNS